MNRAHLLSILLLTTIITNCGGGNTPERVAGEKANEGVASESQPGDSPLFSGIDHIFTPKVKDPKLPEGLAPDLAHFLSSNNLQDRYNMHIEVGEKIKKIVADYPPEEDLDGSIAFNSLIALLDENFRNGMILSELFIKARTEEFKKFDFKGDLTVASNWEPFKKLGRTLTYFPTKHDIENQSLRNYFFPIANDKAFAEKSKEMAKKIESVKGENYLQEIQAKSGKYQQVINDALVEYEQTINAPVTESDLHPAIEGVDYPKEKRENLEMILLRSCRDRVGKILTDTPVASEDRKFEIASAGMRGSEIINGLDKAIEGFAKLDSDNSLQSWHKYLAHMCSVAAISDKTLLATDEFPSHKFYESFTYKASYIKAILTSQSDEIGRMNGLRKWVKSKQDDDELQIKRLSVDLREPDYKPDHLVSKISEEDKIELSYVTSFITRDLDKKIVDHLKTVPEFQELFTPLVPTAAALSAGTPHDVSGNTSLRQARTAATGLVDGSAFKMNGVAGQSIELGMPLFVQLKGDVSSAKSTEAATGSVAYRLGNTVIGAIQGYANSGADFGIDSRQLETSVVASHSFGAFFVEGQVGTVSATEVHNSNWSGLRSQVTLGLDTEFVSPFVQLTHRQLDRSGLDLNETTAYVGLDAEVAKLAADTYSVDTRLLAKAGYGSKAWSAGSNDLGSTTGFSGSVEWSASLNLNSGVTFSSNLALDTLAGSSAAVNVSLDASF